jgi:hypothetical protein
MCIWRNFESVLYLSIQFILIFGLTGFIFKYVNFSLLFFCFNIDEDSFKLQPHLLHDSTYILSQITVTFPS